MFVITRAPPNCNDAPLTIMIPHTVSVQLNGQPNKMYTDTTNAIDRSIYPNEIDNLHEQLFKKLF